MSQARHLLVRAIVAVCFLIPSSTSAQTLPSGWATADIGGPALRGSAAAANGVFTVSGSGYDIWDSSDQFRFVYQRIEGDTQIIARVAGLQGVHAWSKAGVMIRGSLTGPSAHAMLVASAEKGWAFQRRQYDGGFSLNMQQPGAAPGWVRLVREGSLISAYHSVDGSSWKLVGTETVQMPSAVYVGLAITSHNVSATATASFTNVAIRVPSAANVPPTVSIVVPSTGTSFTAPAAVQLSAAAADVDGIVTRVQFFANNSPIGTAMAPPFSVSWSNVAAGSYSITAVADDNGGGSMTSPAMVITVKAADASLPDSGATPGSVLPSPWSTVDVGAPARSGTAAVSDGVFTVAGSGFDIWDTSDQFRFVYQRVTGDAQIVARVASLRGVHAWSKAGVMIRGALTGSSPHAVLFASAEKGWAFQRRPYDGGLSLSTSTQAGVAPGWVRLVRKGQLLSAYQSADGANWTLVGTETVQMAATIYIGLAVTSHNVTASAIATFSSVTISTLASAPASPSEGTGTLPTRVAFNPSSDHASGVTSYIVQLRRATDAVTSTPVATRDLGKPAPVNGEIIVDISTLVTPLESGSYYAVVLAAGPGGASSSDPSPVFSK